MDEYVDVLNENQDISTGDDTDAPVEDVHEGDEYTTEDTRPVVIMQPFFGPDKKYGACPICAAIIITKNDEVEAVCPNCKVDLKLS